MTIDAAYLNPVKPNRTAKARIAIRQLESAIYGIQEAMAVLPESEEIALDTAWSIIRKVHARAVADAGPAVVAVAPPQRSSLWFKKS